VAAVAVETLGGTIMLPFLVLVFRGGDIITSPSKDGSNLKIPNFNFTKQMFPD
jgi:hypothetical protein